MPVPWAHDHGLRVWAHLGSSASPGVDNIQKTCPTIAITGVGFGSCSDV